METQADALYNLTAGYGQDWTQGVISEHLGEARSAGLTITTSPDGAMTVSADDGTTFPVLCSELIMVATEDGPISGRCGRPVIGNGYGCTAHDFDPEPECEHGLSAALCSGPQHY
jgi:hypothetical protein